jgi:hypothetical protein
MFELITHPTVKQLQPDIEKVGPLNFTLSSGSNEIEINNIPSGENGIVFIEAFDKNNEAIGTGCATEVKVQEGKQTEIEIKLFYLS